MKKTITPALLTLALVGFANAARPIVQNPTVHGLQPKPFVAQDAKVLIWKLQKDLANVVQMQKQTLASNDRLAKYLGDARKQVETLKKK